MRRLLDYGGQRHHRLAAAVEFIHTATLLHDDVVDGSDLRRGKSTANNIWGNPASVLVGDFLFSRAFELMVEDGSLRVLRILSGASAVIAEGEVAQLTAQRNVDTREDRYLEIITAKTAVLFAAACQIAAVVAERTPAVEASLEAYGRNLGIAFQLVDDAIDYVSDAGDDGQGCRRRFPRRQGDPAGHPRLRARRRGRPALLARRDARPRRRARASWRMRGGCSTRPGRSTDTLARARHYGARAADALAGFPGQPGARGAARGGRVRRLADVLTMTRADPSAAEKLDAVGQGERRPVVARFRARPRRSGSIPLTGWTGSGDTAAQVRLAFDDLDSAVAYATAKGIDYEVVRLGASTLKLQAYADNFR